MKNIICHILFLALPVTLVFSQNPYQGIADRAKANLRILDKDGYLEARLQFTDSTLTVLNEKFKPEFQLAWKHVPSFLKYVNSQDPELVAKEYHAGILAKTSQHSQVIPEAKPTVLKGLVIAIDPGHFASTPAEAVWEGKYVKIRGKDLAQARDVFFYEAELNDLTSAIVEAQLLTLGARPVRSRPYRSTAFGKSYKKWLSDDFKQCLERDRITKTISDMDFAGYSQIITSYDSQFVFARYYKGLEFRRRVHNIAEAHPALTVNIHYNAHEDDFRDSEGFNKPVAVNYSMAFVAGGFLPNELVTDRDKVDFIRLLVSEEMKSSARLASAILQEEKRVSGIPPVTEKDINFSDLKSRPSGEPGVLHRNLAMTRIVHGPVAYIEALLQDNQQSIVQLTKRDYQFTHPVYGTLKAPMICKLVADSIVKGIQDWLNENKSTQAQD